jgi:hypothetical protein
MSKEDRGSEWDDERIDEEVRRMMERYDELEEQFRNAPPCIPGQTGVVEDMQGRERAFVMARYVAADDVYVLMDQPDEDGVLDGEDLAFTLDELRHQLNSYDLAVRIACEARRARGNWTFVLLDGKPVV